MKKPGQQETPPAALVVLVKGEIFVYLPKDADDFCAIFFKFGKILKILIGILKTFFKSG